MSNLDQTEGAPDDNKKKDLNDEEKKEENSSNIHELQLIHSYEKDKKRLTIDIVSPKLSESLLSIKENNEKKENEAPQKENEKEKEKENKDQQKKSSKIKNKLIKAVKKDNKNKNKNKKKEEEEKEEDEQNKKEMLLLSKLRNPITVCCVVDISGSMSTEATLKDNSGKTESHGLSILDLVKHSIKTIINCLSDIDYLSIVSYSDTAKIEYELNNMNEVNKNNALTALEKLQPTNSTNLWDGLYKGLEQLRKFQNKKQEKNDSLVDYNNSAVLLFTDGLPNVIPPKGHIKMLEEYIDKHSILPGIINTYGFGYSLDSKLLNDLSNKGYGYYHFIPDSSMVGTIFVHSISNLMSNYAKNIKLKIELADIDNDSNNDIKIIGNQNNNYNYTKTSWGIELNLGNIMYEQNKNITILFGNNNNNKDKDNNEGNNDTDNNNNNNNQKDFYEISDNSLIYTDMKQQKILNVTNIKKYDNNNLTQDKKIENEINYYRLKTVDVLFECMELTQLNELNKAQSILKELIKEIKENNLIKNNDFIKNGLLLDLSGQIFESISKLEWYNRWGKHYLLSIINSHLYQYNNNFKDPGVQFYGGTFFNKLKNIADKIFIKLPAPKPSVVDYSHYGYNTWGGGGGGQKQAAVYKPPVNMNAYMNVHGGCFEGNGKVLMADNSLKYIYELKKGDLIQCGGVGKYAMIACVIKFKCDLNECYLSKVSNNHLLITPWHPIMNNNNEWVFPADVSTPKLYKNIDYVYNFILDNNHIITVNNIKCCTFGHNFSDNEVIKHEYFGSNKIIKDLSLFNGYHNGLIILDAKNCFKINPNTNRIQSIIPVYGQ